MVQLLQRYESYARVIQFLMTLTGVWPGNTSTTYFRLNAIVVAVTVSIVFYGQLTFIKNNISDVSIVTKSLAPSVDTFGTLQKLVVFTIFRHYVMELHEILDVTFRKDLENDEEMREMMLGPLKYFEIPTLFLARSYTLISSMYACAPLIMIILQSVRGISPVDLNLPIPTQYPWAIEGNVVLYGVYYIIEAIAVLSIAFLGSGTDTLFGLYVFQITAQFRVMAHRLKNMKATDDYQLVMRECAVRYGILLKCKHLLQHIYGSIVLCLMITTAICECANIYQTSKMNSDNIVVVALYTVSKLSQAFLYAWNGMFLIVETERFREAVYNCGWPGSGEKPFMTNILIMMTMQPFELSACHFAIISLDMFTAILNTSVSYFFLLRTLEG